MTKNPQLLITYFPSAEKAESENQKTLQVIEKLKIKEQKKKEAEILFVETQNLLKIIDQYLGEISSNNYSMYGLSYKEWYEITDKIREVKFEINVFKEEPEKIKELNKSLEETKKRLEEAISFRRKEILKLEMVKNKIKECYSICPLCKTPLEGGSCINLHNVEQLEPIPDEIDTKINISQIVTDAGKIVARLVLQYEKRKGIRGWYVNLLNSPYQFSEEEAWKGEDFQSLKFQEFVKILDPETAQKRKIEREYKKQLEFAEEQVKQGFWKKGSFVLGKHPKTGEPQWEITVKRKGFFVKFIVDMFSYYKPTSENNIYFFSEVRKIVDTPSFQLITVQIEPPLPEEKPESFVEELQTKNKEKISNAPPSLASLEELKRKWGAK